MKLRLMGSGSSKLEVSPDLELHPESLQRPTRPGWDEALLLQHKEKSARNRIHSAMLCERRVD